jgi:hypothetical protein
MIDRSHRRAMTMPTNLQKLIDAARGRPFTEEDREAQRRSFAYGNTHIENPRITRKTVDEQAELLTNKAPKLDR